MLLDNSLIYIRNTVVVNKKIKQFLCNPIHFSYGLLFFYVSYTKEETHTVFEGDTI